MLQLGIIVGYICIVFALLTSITSTAFSLILQVVVLSGLVLFGLAVIRQSDRDEE